MALWDESYIITTYEMACEGCSQNQIIRVIGTTRASYIKWKTTHPALREALRRGYVQKRKRTIALATTQTFREYIFDQLSPDLQAIWKTINRLETMRDGRKKIDALLVKRGQRARQNLFVHAWTTSNWSLSRALRKVSISYNTFRTWKDDDPNFAMLIDEIDWHKKNFFEEHLCKLVARGDSPATIFANRTKNRDRGYAEHVKHDVDGTMKHTGVVSVDQLDLPIEMRRMILDRMRDRKHVDNTDITGGDRNVLSAAGL